MPLESPVNLLRLLSIDQLVACKFDGIFGICSGTEILSIEFCAAASEVTPIYHSKSYLHNVSTARAHSLNFKYTFIVASSFWALESWFDRDQTAVSDFTRFG